MSDPIGKLAVDIYQTATNVVIVAPIAGLTENEIQIDLNQDILTISGERRNYLKKVTAEDYLAHECYWGPFERKIILPPLLDADKIKADYTNGILKITIPKISSDKKKKTIPIT